MIRDANYNDLDDMVLLLKELFSIEKDFEFNRVKHENGLRRILESDKRCKLFVYEYDNKAIAMCSVQLLISTAEGEYSAVIEDVVVNKNHHGEGVGKKLIDSAEKWAMEKGATRVTLLADMDNSNALGFYDRLDIKRTNMICLKKHI